MNVTLKVDTREFEATRKEYMRYTKRDLATILNTKAFFIARRAVIETPRVSLNRLGYEFGAANIPRFSQKKQRFVRTRKYEFNAKAFGSEVPRLAVIINARRAKAGKKGLEGAEMAKALQKVFNARRKSTGFMASGWLGAVAALDVITSDRRGVAPRDSSVKRVGRMKGGATAAKASGWTQTATIWNTASTTRDRKAALNTYGIPALQRAIDFEVASMKEYMERKLRERLQKLGIKFL
jgi:predicted component of type VI protein secretion system